MLFINAFFRADESLDKLIVVTQRDCDVVHYMERSSDRLTALQFYTVVKDVLDRNRWS